jgi:hypothetical protein
MSGEVESQAKTAKVNMDAVVAKLDEYENGLGLEVNVEPPVPQSELTKYLTMDRDELSKLDPEDCDEIAYRLGQYCFYLNQQFNKEKAREIWAKSEIDRCVHDNLDNYKQFGNEYKIQSIAKENSYVAAILIIQSKAQQRSARLTYLGKSMENLSDTLKNSARTKLSNRRNERAGEA